MKQLARQYVYWPKLDAEIEKFVQNCAPCQQAAKAPTKTNLHSWPKPRHPWERIHIDYAGPFYGKDYLVIVDSFSKYPEVYEMSSTSSKATIDKLRYLFSRHGLPETLVSDNGTQFASSEFAKFTSVNGINHRFSAPYNPMSNGQAERFVDTFKRTFRKLKGEGAPSKEVIETFLVTDRTTPNAVLPGGQSPAEMFLGRRPRTTLDMLKPPSPPPTEQDEAMEQRFNKHFGTKPTEFTVGDNVFARHRISQNWWSGKISKRNGVIYDVSFADGRVKRFHANQIRPRHGHNNDGQLDIFLEAFNVTTPRVEERVVLNEENEDRRVGEPNGAQPANAPDADAEEPQQHQPPPGIHPDRPRRNRRAPRRYSPGQA
uniref:RNA-directed DNA polymerase n=1 Tax=Globodera rostochiensis TaxID=31243 RepID=A0A914GT85_GLORO